MNVFNNDALYRVYIHKSYYAFICSAHVIVKKCDDDEAYRDDDNDDDNNDDGF